MSQPRPRTAKSARAAAPAPTREDRPTRFRAMYTRVEAGHLEEALLDVRSHMPRRTALAILTFDSDALVRCYGDNADALQSLLRQGEDIDGYMANQREFLELMMKARARITFVAQRIAAERPDLLPREPRPGDYAFF